MTKEHTLLKKALAASIPAIAASLLAGGPAWANNAGTTFRMSVPAADAGFALACGGTELTATGGTASIVMHESVDQNGVYHMTGTGTLNHVTMQDASGNAYSVSGANWFGGSSSDPDANEPIAFTSTDKFVVRNANGGVLGMVNVVEHISPNGNYFDFEFGTCTN